MTDFASDRVTERRTAAEASIEKICRMMGFVDFEGVSLQNNDSAECFDVATHRSVTHVTWSRAPVTPMSLVYSTVNGRIRKTSPTVYLMRCAVDYPLVINM